MMKRLLPVLLLSISSGLAFGQANYDYGRLKTERLDRGVVAVRQADGKVAISWRILRDDKKGEAFDVFRNGQKLNAQELTSGGSMFVDEHPLQGEDAVYEVRGGHHTGSFVLCNDWPADYIPLKLDKPEGGKVPVNATPPRQSRRQGQNNRWRGWRDTGEYSYTANDASVGDVDGDGQYEIILKWDPTNARDNAHDGYTGPTLLDCYRLNGERLWRINLGRNIRSGAHYVPYIVYDLDGDGRAELMVKTADGTIDGTGTAIGDTAVDYRSKTGRILEGPEYITVFDGLTGRALDTKPYIPERGKLEAWGDSRGNRSERYLAAVGYFGKRTPSAVFCRGYYTRSVLVAWDWNGKKLIASNVFDTNNPLWESYAGQGNHNLRVADVDGDGYDEITYGSMAIDHDFRGLYNTGFGHGDAMHLIAEPTTNKLFIWDCHENKRDGSELRDAKTGEVVFQIKSKEDVGRAMAADIDPTSPGMEMWSTDSHGIRNMKGEKTHPRPLPAREGGDYTQGDNTVLELSTPLSIREGQGESLQGESLQGKSLRMPVNFGIWWDGDLLRELLDHETVWKYNWQEKSVDQVVRLDGVFNNGTKSNPCLQADILGDWREEVIMRNRESTELRIFVSTIPTPYRINCLMQDIPYRISVATENVGYNQPPEPGFYIGPDEKSYLK